MLLRVTPSPLRAVGAATALPRAVCAQPPHLARGLTLPSTAGQRPPLRAPQPKPQGGASSDFSRTQPPTRVPVGGSVGAGAVAHTPKPPAISATPLVQRFQETVQRLAGDHVNQDRHSTSSARKVAVGSSSSSEWLQLEVMAAEALRKLGSGVRADEEEVLGHHSHWKQRTHSACVLLESCQIARQSLVRLGTHSETISALSRATFLTVMESSKHDPTVVNALVMNVQLPTFRGIIETINEGLTSSWRPKPDAHAGGDAADNSAAAAASSEAAYFAQNRGPLLALRHLIISLTKSAVGRVYMRPKNRPTPDGSKAPRDTTAALLLPYRRLMAVSSVMTAFAMMPQQAREIFRPSLVTALALEQTTAAPKLSPLPSIQVPMSEGTIYELPRSVIEAATAGGKGLKLPHDAQSAYQSFIHSLLKALAKLETEASSSSTSSSSSSLLMGEDGDEAMCMRALDAACLVLKSDSSLRTRFGIGLISEARVPQAPDYPLSPLVEATRHESGKGSVPPPHPLISQLHAAVFKLQTAKARQLGPYNSNPFARARIALPPPADMADIMRTLTSSTPAVTIGDNNASKEAIGSNGVFFSLFRSNAWEQFAHYNVMSALAQAYKGSSKAGLPFEVRKHYVAETGTQVDCALLLHKPVTVDKQLVKGIVLEYDGSEVHEAAPASASSTINLEAAASASSQLCSALLPLLPLRSPSDPGFAAEAQFELWKPDMETIAAAFKKATISLPLSMLVPASQLPASVSPSAGSTTMVSVRLDEWALQFSLERWLIVLFRRLTRKRINQHKATGSVSATPCADAGSPCALCGASSPSSPSSPCILQLNNNEVHHLSNAVHKRAKQVIAGMHGQSKQEQEGSSDSSDTEVTKTATTRLRDEVLAASGYSVVSIGSREFGQLMGQTGTKDAMWSGYYRPDPAAMALSIEGRAVLLKRLAEAGLPLP